MTGDTITILQARGRRLAKLIQLDGTVQGYDDAKHFSLHEEPVDDLDALANILRRLQHRQDCAIVRGGIIDPALTRNVRRLAYADLVTGDAATLREVSHRWPSISTVCRCRPAPTRGTSSPAGRPPAPRCRHPSARPAASSRPAPATP